MKVKLIWAFIQDTKGISDIYTVNGLPVTHPELHTIVGVKPTNPNVGSDCKAKLFHSKTDIIYPLELDLMVACYNATPSVSKNVVNNGIQIVNHTQRVING